MGSIPRSTCAAAARRQARHRALPVLAVGDLWPEEHAAYRAVRQHGLVNTVVDEPAGFTNSIPSIWEATHADLALVRLHGRNHQTWNLKGLTSSAQRFNYDYTQEELEALSENIHALSGKVGMVHVIFNNNYEDQGMRNARSLIAILRTRHPGAIASWSK